MDNYKRGFRESEQLPSEMMHRCKRLKQQQSSSIRFNEDIFAEILLRLPVKSVVKFKTVSKLWVSISSSHRFRQNHASRQQKVAATGLFFPLEHMFICARLPINVDRQIKSKIKYSYTSYRVKRTADYRYSMLTCVSSCNGLQLFKSPKSPKSNAPDHMYHVYNPTTGESKDVLDIPPHISNNKFVCASLAFDPYESLHYKIIFLWRRYSFSNNFQLEVYSSTTGTCKAPASNTFAGVFNYDENCGIFCNGAIHWLSSDATWIVYFNIHTECIKELRTPRLACNILYLGESQGHLHLVNSNHQYFYKSSVLDVYELKGDYSGWFQKYQVDLASIASVVLPQQVYPRKDYGTFMSIFRDEEVDDDSTMVLLACNQWVQYNFKEKTTKRLCRYMLPGLCTSRFPWSYGFNTHQFIPTLTCI